MARSSFPRVVIFAVLAFALGAPSPPQETVDWYCGAAKGSTCYFSIRYVSGGNRNFTMRGGEQDRISGVVPNQDTFCVCIDTPTPNDWSQCKPGFQGKFCRTDVIRRGQRNG